MVMTQASCERYFHVANVASGSTDLAPDLLVCACAGVCIYVCVCKSTCVLWLGKSAIADDQNFSHVLLGRILTVPLLRDSFLLILK